MFLTDNLPGISVSLQVLQWFRFRLGKCMFHLFLSVERYTVKIYEYFIVNEGSGGKGWSESAVTV